MSDLADTYRGWPLWARVGSIAALVVLAGSLVAGAQSPRESNIETAPTSDDAPASVDTTRRTTTSQRSTTTSTTSTTSTLPPTTAPPTVPPTTTPPPPPPPPPPPAPALAPAPAPPPSDCHPSYDPCVPILSDVDCAGGSGDGPGYTGTVRVIGPDVYDLDRDNDGTGCDP